MKHTTWELVRGGYHRTVDGKWEAKKADRKWDVYRWNGHRWELWGSWNQEPWGKDYVPFDSLAEAKDIIDEYEFRGLD